MYDLSALKRKISKEGLSNVIQYLLSDELPPDVKQALEKEKVFLNGYLCISLVCSLA